MADYNDPAVDYEWLMKEILLHETEQAMALGFLLMRLFPALERVIDIGCGPGIYLTPFKNAEMEVLGVDIANNGGECLEPGQFRHVDLRQPWTPPKFYDLALCIEVGEHLRPEFHATLVETVARSAPVVFWSAAHPGQGGEGHYGEAPPEYWFNLFAGRGFAVDWPLTNLAHQTIDSNEAYAHCNWLRLHSHLLRRG